VISYHPTLSPHLNVESEEMNIRKLLFAGSLILLVFVTLMSWSQAVSAQQGAQTPTPEIISRGGTQDASGSRSPSALTSQLLSNPYCYQPDPSVDQCIINIRYYYATDNQSAPPYMIWVNMSINSKLRLRENTFFEGTVYYDATMTPMGFKVPCGAPNAGGGGTLYGNSYFVRVEPIDSNGASMGYNQANLFCPAYSP
jgi:hypothetical protein